MDELEDLRVVITDSRLFVLDTLQEAQREDLFTELDDENLADEVFIAINQLVQIMGGEIQVSEESKAEDRTPNLKALIGRRYHINIKKAVWKALLACVPITVNLIRGMATHDPSAFALAGGSVLSVIDIYRDNLQRLQPDEVALYLAVKALGKQTGKPSQAEAIAGYLRTQTKDENEWTDEIVQTKLDRMTLKKVLKEGSEGYSIIV